MKAVMKIFLAGAILVFAGVELNAQEKKKKPQDNAYMEQKHRADEQRKQDAEAKRKNDSIQRVHYRDSLDASMRADSIKYSKMGAPDSINPPGQQRLDSLEHHDVPPQDKEMDKGTPPKGPNPGVRRIDFGTVFRHEDDIIS